MVLLFVVLTRTTSINITAIKRQPLGLSVYLLVSLSFIVLGLIFFALGFYYYCTSKMQRKKKLREKQLRAINEDQTEFFHNIMLNSKGSIRESPHDAKLDQVESNHEIAPTQEKKRRPSISLIQNLQEPPVAPSVPSFLQGSYPPPPTDSGFLSTDRPKFEINDDGILGDDELV